MTLSEQLCQALWAAMHDDDDLAHTFAHFAVMIVLKDFVYSHVTQYLNADQRTRLFDALGKAHAEWYAISDEFAQRWSSYEEPPF